MLGTIYEWFYSSVLGVRNVERAYRVFEVVPPYLAEFEEVEGSVDCPYGVIQVAFKRSGRQVRVNVTVPFGCSCKFELAGESSKVRRDGGEEKFVEGDLVELTHGDYRIEVTLPEQK